MKSNAKIIVAILSLMLLMAVFCVNTFAYTESDSYYYSDGSITVSNDALYASATSPDTQLNDFQTLVYEQVKEKAAAVANGDKIYTAFQIDADFSSLSWTKEELGCTIVSGGAITQEAQEAVAERFSEAMNTHLLLQYLLADCPYEFFWYDKTVGASCGYGISATTGKISILTVTISFTVSADYRSGNASDYKVDSSKIAAGSTAVAKAQQIVDKYKDLDDIDKLIAYRDEICNLVSYNTAATSGTYPYGNPWQLIYVFDGNSSTNVVCEGYAKAFKYLCDLSDFDSDVYCYLVSGLLGANGSSEGHMWNVLSIDGVNYMVDVTNYDSNNGRYEDMFLGGATSYNGGIKHVLSNGFAYTYYDDQMNLFCEGFLVLTSTTYHEHSYGSYWHTNSDQHWHQCSCGAKTDVADHTPSSVGSCMQRSTCEVCGVKYGSFLSHNYNQKITDSAHLKSEATCTKKAVYYYSCTCGAVGSDTFEYGETLPHDFTVKKVENDYLASAANCTNKAVYYFSCKCGAKSESTYEYGSVGTHNYDQQNTDAKYLVRSATCTKKAVYYYSCVCGLASVTMFEYGDLADHEYVGGICSSCGTPEDDDTNWPGMDCIDPSYPDDDADLSDDYADEPMSFIDLLIAFIMEIITAILEALFGF